MVVQFSMCFTTLLAPMVEKCCKTCLSSGRGSSEKAKTRVRRWALSLKRLKFYSRKWGCEPSMLPDDPFDSHGFGEWWWPVLEAPEACRRNVGQALSVCWLEAWGLSWEWVTVVECRHISLLFAAEPGACASRTLWERRACGPRARWEPRCLYFWPRFCIIFAVERCQITSHLLSKADTIKQLFVPY